MLEDAELKALTWSSSDHNSESVTVSSDTVSSECSLNQRFYTIMYKVIQKNLLTLEYLTINGLSDGRP